MYRFAALDEVQSALQRLVQREPPLVKVLPRQPGTKEARYMHLLSGDVEAYQPSTLPEAGTATVPALPERMAELEQQVASLREEVARLREELAALRKPL
jgi:uncharacterized protein YceH (UPF0502 family)